MINLGDANNRQEELVLRIFKSMEDGNIPEVMAEICHIDFRWENSGLPTLHGQQEILELLANGGFANKIPILRDMTHFTADLIHIASNDNVVFTERVDHHWDKDGRDLMTPHIAGIVEIADDKIMALKDFYDTSCYQQEPTEADPAFALKV